ncbi:serine hydrolase [Algoriphagus resistens]|uniref:serine hydrolase n=1 Tax=Algoriphagus resistens TaxID=1750590 RepID=UPI000716AAC3|nr:serine hydrolase [Algoriphagus resistens]
MKTTFLFTLIISCLTIGLLSSCQEKVSKAEQLNSTIISQLDSIKGDVAVAYINLSDPSDSLMINAEQEFHAASTMKVPVMIELFKQESQGKFNLNDSILLKNEFRSIVDSSLYSMDIGDDSDDVIYSKIGTRQSLRDLMYSMITVSSNLATNVLIELVDAKNVTATMRELGADKIEVLRGVEDTKAYELGMSNTTNAKDLLIVMKAIAENKAGTNKACEEMISTLTDQKFNTIIPFYLPETVSVAHKTGSISGVHHDAGIVYLPDGRSYVLVILSKNLEDYDTATEQLARISKTVYEYVLNSAS